MNDLSITDASILILTLFCLLIGLSFNLHRNHAIFLWSGFTVISGIFNPIFFMANEYMYTDVGWSAVRSFDFSFAALVKSYSGFCFIYSLIIILSLPVILRPKKIVCVSTGQGTSLSGKNDITNRVDKSNDPYRYLLIICTSLIALYFPLYNHGIGVTGLPGELPFHFSGIVHYVRSYIVPVMLTIILYRTAASWQVIITLCVYAFVAGVSAASRFVGFLPVILAMLYLVSLRRYWMVVACVLYCFFLWFAISASRDLTFDGDQHDLFTVIYYSLTNISTENVINTLDLLSGRFSGAQQMVLASQLRGHDECGFIFRFLLGMGDICTDTAGIVYGLDLSGTAYGLGLALIPSIVISGDSIMYYVFPAVYICCLIWASQFAYRKISAKPGWEGIGTFYLFMSVLFIYLGQLSFYYVLQFASFVLIMCESLYAKRYSLFVVPSKIGSRLNQLPVSRKKSML